MNVKINDKKLDKLKDIIIDFLGVNEQSFQRRFTDIFYIEFLTPGTRKNVIARLYPASELVEINEDKFFELVGSFVPSHKIYDIIKNDLIKKIYLEHSYVFKMTPIENIKKFRYSSDQEFEKQKYRKN